MILVIAAAVLMWKNESMIRFCMKFFADFPWLFFRNGCGIIQLSWPFQKTVVEALVSTAVFGNPVLCLFLAYFPWPFFNNSRAKSVVEFAFCSSDLRIWLEILAREKNVSNWFYLFFLLIFGNGAYGYPRTHWASSSEQIRNYLVLLLYLNNMRKQEYTS